jgi:hypothetical protein
MDWNTRLNAAYNAAIAFPHFRPLLATATSGASGLWYGFPPVSSDQWGALSLSR